MDDVFIVLEAQAQEAPDCEGVYRLYQGARLLHIGMAAGTATLRSELLLHARGAYGPATQCADRIAWEVAPDDLFAYELLIALYAAAMYAASGSGGDELGPSASRRHAPAVQAG